MDNSQHILKVAPKSEQVMQKTLDATEILCSVIVIQRVPKYVEMSLNYYVLKIVLKDVGALQVSLDRLEIVQPALKRMVAKVIFDMHLI